MKLDRVRILESMKEKRYGVSELARKAHLANGTVSKILSRPNEVNVNFRTLINLSTVLGLSIGEIIKEE